MCDQGPGNSDPERSPRRRACEQGPREGAAEGGRPGSQVSRGSTWARFPPTGGRWRSVRGRRWCDDPQREQCTVVRSCALVGRGAQATPYSPCREAGPHPEGYRGSRPGGQVSRLPWERPGRAWPGSEFPGVCFRGCTPAVKRSLAGPVWALRPSHHTWMILVRGFEILSPLRVCHHSTIVKGFL